MAESTRAAIYTRVSTSSRSRYGAQLAFDQRPEVQEAPLQRMAEQRGWEVAGVYADRISGTKEKRPALDRLMSDARRGCFDVVMVWRFDRFARSTRHLVNALEEFRSLDIEFVSHQEAIDTGTPTGRAVFYIVAAMAQLERELTVERVRAGVEHARQAGTKSGKPVGRPRAVFRRDQVAELRASGLSWREIALKLGVGAGTVRRAFEAANGLMPPCQNPNPGRPIEQAH